MNMRNLILAIICLFCAGIGRAEIVGSNLELIPSDVTIGPENTGSLTININTDIQTLHDYQFKLTLPAGFTIASDESDEYLVTPGTTGQKHNFVIGKAETYAEHEYNLVAADLNVKRFLAVGNNSLVNIEIKAPADWNGETVEGSVSKVKFSAIDTATDRVSKFVAPDYTFKVSKEVNTGITEVTADWLADAEIYDLNGVRLDNIPLGQVLIAVRGGVSMKVVVIK